MDSPETTPTYFPGKDYPDRDKWLAIRAMQRVKRDVLRVYAPQENGKLIPLDVGMNKVKREADVNANPKDSRQEIVRHRHQHNRKVNTK